MVVGQHIVVRRFIEVKWSRMKHFSSWFMVWITKTMIFKEVSSISLIPNHQRQSSVAIIGGGIAGLSCAHRLLEVEPSLDVTVFDTGKYQVGGRCSSRGGVAGGGYRENDKAYPILSKSTYDHAAQILAVPPLSNPVFAAFQQQLDQWQRDKVIVEYPTGSICTIDGDRGGNVVTPKQNMKAYYGVNGMGSIPFSISQSIPSTTIRQDVWVSPSNGVRRKDGQWFVQSSKERFGAFDQLVIAHNGKCADRLMSQTPATAVHKLLQVNFAPTIPDHGGSRMTLNSIYSLTFALDASSSPLSRRLPEPFICGEIGSPVSTPIQFLTCQTRKYPRHDGVEVWTVLSSPAFAKQYKAPQEFLPDDVVANVTSRLLGAVQMTLGLPSEQKIRPLESRLQLWGAALPINVWQPSGDYQGFIYDAEHQVGVCGDWLVEPSIAGAWTSGRLLADHLLLMSSSSPPATTGLTGSFVKNAKAQQSGLAAFPAADDDSMAVAATPTTSTTTTTTTTTSKRAYTRPKRR
jgi:predicted NAD/FAD-dependent oxidoreductase